MLPLKVKQKNKVKQKKQNKNLTSFGKLKLYYKLAKFFF